MSNDDMRRLFDTVLTAPRPDGTDIDSAMRTSRRRHQRRTAAVVVTSVAAVAVVGGLLVSSLPKPDAPPVGGPSATSSPTPTFATQGALVTSATTLFGSWWTTELDGADVRAVRDRSGNPLIARFMVNDADGTLWWGANDGCNDHGGDLSVSSAGRFSAEVGVSTLVGCTSAIQQQPRNVAALNEADQARVVPASSTSPRQLELSRDGAVLARYDAVPDADPTRRSGTVLTSGPTDDPGSGMAAIVTGRLTLDKGDCLGLDGQSTVFPQGTSWAPALGLLVLPDGRTARIGDTLSGGGGYLPSSDAKPWVENPEQRGICTWTAEVRVFNKDSQVTVGD